MVTTAAERNRPIITFTNNSAATRNVSVAVFIGGESCTLLFDIQETYMPTQQTTYNSRVTDEALEKKFRDTFKSQGGAELVDDLYASGVIVPVVDFTSAAEGSALRSDLQTAWDFSTTLFQRNATGTGTIFTGPGFWQIDFTATIRQSDGPFPLDIFIDDGSSTATVWSNRAFLGSAEADTVIESKFVIFMRAGDTLKTSASTANYRLDLWYP